MYEITSRFLERESFRKKGHSGIDFAMEDGTPLRTIKDGVATVKNYGDTNAGLTVKIRWNNGKEAIYGHMSDTTVHTGDKVHAGDLIGHSGHSGHVVSDHGNGAHLHFGLKEDGHFVDPSPYTEQIQHMNTPGFFQKAADKIEVAQKKYTITDLWNEQANVYQDFFQSLKMNLAHFLVSVDYSMLMEHIKGLLQLFTC